MSSNPTSVIDVRDLVAEASHYIQSAHTKKTRELMTKFEKDIQDILSRTSSTQYMSQWILK